MDVLDDHTRGRLLFIELGPLFDPQRKGLVLPQEQKKVGSYETSSCSLI